MHAVGSTVGRFLLNELLFQNAPTSIYRATDTANNAVVALKLVNARQTDNQRAQERLLAEGSAASLLNHPNIVRQLEVGETGQQAYISMELITQPTLAQHLKAHGRLPRMRALTIARDIAMALQYAHRRGLVHRDIKPGNIFLDDHKTPARLGDFGIALPAHLERIGMQDPAQDAYATPVYMSPEQAMGRHIDALSDQYSLGCVLFEMLTGQVPHAGSDLKTLINQIASAPSPTLRSIDPQLPKSLERVVQRMMRKRPQQRYADCEALTKTLNAAHALLDDNGGKTPAE